MPATEILVVVPGIMGSVLEDPSGAQVWPAEGCGLLMQFSDEEVDHLLAEDLRATDVIRNVSFKSVYRSLLKLLERCGYAERTDANPGGTLYAWPYDWRRDLRDTADRFAEFLDGVVAIRGDVEFTVVAHSMGGLVARTYLESAAYANRPARPRVRNLITLGTPHRGAPVALAHAAGLLGKLWLSADQAKRVVNDARYPSTYQLLPPDDEPFLWNRGGRHEPRTLDAALAGGLQLTASSLDAMRQWRTQLEPARRGGVRLFCFLGSTHETITSIWVANANGGGVNLTLEERPSGGDATVPFTSATLAGLQHYELEGEHGEIFQDDMVGVLLPRLLGKKALLAVSETGAVQLSLTQPIVPRAQPTRGVLVLRHDAARARRLTGELQVVPQPGWTWEGGVAPAAMRAHRFEVSNIQSERLAFELDTPAQPGAYLVKLRLDWDGAHAELEEPLGVRRDL